MLHSGNVELIKHLVDEYGVKVTTIDKDNGTPLFYAVQKLDNECVKFILKNTPKR